MKVQHFVANNAGGLEITSQLARSVARLRKPTRLSSFTEIQALPAFIAFLNQKDPRGRYELSVADPDVAGIKRFLWFFFAPSWWILDATHVQPLLTVDGTAIQTILMGALLIAVTKSANNNLYPLAMMYCDFESAANVEVFGARLRKLFPSQEDAVSDSGTGLVAGLDNAGFRRNGGCFWHITYKNVPTEVRRRWVLFCHDSRVLKFPGVPKALQDSLKELLHLPSEAQYREKLDEIRGRPFQLRKKSYPIASVNEVLDYVDTRFQEEHLCLWLTLRLDPPFVRYGQTTNNPAEQENNVVGDARGLPIISMVLNILSKDNETRCKHQASAEERFNASQASPNLSRLRLTPFVVTDAEEVLARCKRWEVDIHVLTGMSLKVTVRHGKDLAQDQRVELELRADGTMAVERCCGLEKELDRPCAFMLIALDRASKRRKPSPNPWTPFDPRFYGKFWLTSTWVAQYHTVAQSINVAVEKLARDPAILPWSSQPKVGRPKAMPEFTPVEGRAYKTCWGCGKQGHNLSRCVNVDLDLLYQNLTQGVDETYKEPESDDRDMDWEYMDGGEYELEANEIADLHKDIEEVQRPKSRGRELVELLSAIAHDPDASLGKRRRK